MATGSWSNIFLQLMAGKTPPLVGLPVIGEGQLELPWKTQIELLSFTWDLEFNLDDAEEKESGGLGMLGAAAGVAGGNLAGAVGGQAGLAVAAAAAATAAA